MRARNILIDLLIEAGVNFDTVYSPPPDGEKEAVCSVNLSCHLQSLALNLQALINCDLMKRQTACAIIRFAWKQECSGLKTTFIRNEEVLSVEAYELGSLLLMAGLLERNVLSSSLEEYRLHRKSFSEILISTGSVNAHTIEVAVSLLQDNRSRKITLDKAAIILQQQFKKEEGNHSPGFLHYKDGVSISTAA